MPEPAEMTPIYQFRPRFGLKPAELAPKYVEICRETRQIDNEVAVYPIVGLTAPFLGWIEG